MKILGVKTGYLLPFGLLLVIGLSVHHPSFNLSLYGDDWIDVFQYRTHIEPYAHFSPLPGLLKYLAPYGFTIFLIGNVFKIFGTLYAPYFVTSFLFRFLASVGFFLILQEMSGLIYQKATMITKVLSFLFTVLFLVGYTGIQTTDWAHYMNIYLATGLFLFSLTFQLKFYSSYSLKHMFLSLVLLALCLIVGSLRLYPILVLMPITDLCFYLLNKTQVHSKRIIIKMLIFLCLGLIFWGIGLFGSPFGFYSYGEWTITKFLSAVTLNPVLALKSNLYLVGALLIPDRLNLNPALSILIGAISLITLSVVNVKSIKAIKKSIWQIIFGLFFYIFVFTIWYFGPTSFISSEHRYLFVIFAFFLLWLYLLALLIIKSVKVSKAIILSTICLLIILHGVSTREYYLHLLDKGRDFRFAKKVEETIIKDLPTNPSSAPFVHFRVDDGEVEQNLLFGLAMKTLVFKQIWNTKYFFNQYDNMAAMKIDLQKEIDKGQSREELLNTVYAFEVRNKEIRNITADTRKNLF